MTLRRPGTGTSDQGSMPMALLITLVAMALSATLMPLVINQVTSTRTVSSRCTSLTAAAGGRASRSAPSLRCSPPKASS